jgi:hypothetical protein
MNGYSEFEGRMEMDAYNLLIRFGRMLEDGHKFSPELVLSTVQYIDNNLRWTPVEDFFRLFPPLKRYEDDGSWDYNSTLDFRKERFGERFGKDDFLELLMNTTYENRFLRRVGLAFMLATSRIRKRRTGMTMVEEFLNK